MKKGIFQILELWVLAIYAVELSLLLRFICEVYISLNSLLRPLSGSRVATVHVINPLQFYWRAGANRKQN